MALIDESLSNCTGLRDFIFFDGYFDNKRRSFAELAFSANLTAVARNDIFDNTKSQTGSLASRLGREERLKNFIDILRPYSAAVVG